MVVMGSAIEKRGSFNTAVSLANDYKRLYCKRLYGEGSMRLKNEMRHQAVYGVNLAEKLHIFMVLRIK
jgi:hypothetical protein